MVILMFRHDHLWAKFQLSAGHHLLQSGKPFNFLKNPKHKSRQLFVEAKYCDISSQSLHKFYNHIRESYFWCQWQQIFPASCLKHFSKLTVKPFFFPFNWRQNNFDFQKRKLSICKAFHHQFHVESTTRSHSSICYAMPEVNLC